MKNNVTIIVLLKELKDMFRDKKTIIMSLVIPIVMFPVLFWVMGFAMNSNSATVNKNLKIAISDKGNSSFGQFVKAQKNVNIIASTNPEQDVKDGKVYLYLEIPENMDESLKSEKVANISITYDNSSQQSSTAGDMINSFMTAYSKEVVASRLKGRNIDTNILTPIIIDTKTVTKADNGIATMILSLMLPLLLMVYSVSGPIPAATDQGAGEKERGTLEPLLTTQAGRMSLLWGKFLSITIIGLMTMVASMIGLYIGMTENGGMFSTVGSAGGASTGGFNLDIKAILFIGLVTVLFTMAFGALELAVSIFARSFKEAQTYLSPLIIIALVPTYGTYMLDAKNIDILFFNIPIANGVCLLKEFISGIYNYGHMAITFGWLIVYIVGSIALATYMFNKEEVIFRT